jgi:hypothetical protein
MSPALPLQLHRRVLDAFRPLWLWLARKKLRQALDSYHRGQYSDTCTACEAVLQIYPSYAEASYVTGRACLYRGCTELAASSFEHAMRCAGFPTSALCAALAYRRHCGSAGNRGAFRILAFYTDITMAEARSLGYDWDQPCLSVPAA